jgi:hypothetical protein
MAHEADADEPNTLLGCHGSFPNCDAVFPAALSNSARESRLDLGPAALAPERMIE